MLPSLFYPDAMHRGSTGSAARIGSRYVGKEDLAMEPKSYTLILAAVAPVLPKQSAQTNEDEESSHLPM